MDALGGDDGMGIPSMPESPMGGAPGGDPMGGPTGPDPMSGGPGGVDPMDNDSLENDGSDNGDFGGNDDSEENLGSKEAVEKYSGKLSQALYTYNKESEEPDVDLNKYAAKMINKQASQVLTDKAKKEVIKTIKNGSMGNDDEDEGEQDNNDDIDLATESIIREICNSLTDISSKNRKKRVSKMVDKEHPCRNFRKLKR